MESGYSANEWASINRFPDCPLAVAIRLQRAMESAMRKKTDKEYKNNENCDLSPERPPWYPENYPTWLVTDACLALFDLVASGAVIDEMDSNIQAVVIFVLMDVGSCSEEVKMETIKYLILATNPNLTDREIQVFIQGVVHVYAANHAQPIPQTDRFHKTYPHFRKMADRDDTQLD